MTLAIHQCRIADAQATVDGQVGKIGAVHGKIKSRKNEDSPQLRVVSQERKWRLQEAEKMRRTGMLMSSELT